MADKTKIVNRALTLLGVQPIVSIDDGTPQARIAGRIYDTSLESALSETLWTFATKRALLATLDETPAWSLATEGFTTVYQIPTDCVRVMGVNAIGGGVKWKQESGKILANTAGLGIKYVFFNDDPTKYSASFVRAFADLLASDMAYPILNSNTKRQELYESYEKISLPKAISENAQASGRPDVLDDSYYDLARYGGANCEEM